MQPFRSMGMFDSRPPADYINSKVLLANTAEREAIPSTANLVVISGTANTYVKFGTSGVTA